LIGSGRKIVGEAEIQLAVASRMLFVVSQFRKVGAFMLTLERFSFIFSTSCYCYSFFLRCACIGKRLQKKFILPNKKKVLNENT
jgi:hypothetical protein